ncbi:MAG TPA: hypothetical protein GX017_02300 [Clostridiales bacterium]|jgi:putative multiple sugar transport system permease protein|nr:hypothetical protein [Clostridiales bacterium]
MVSIQQTQYGAIPILGRNCCNACCVSDVTIAGVIISGRLNAATPKAGTGFELDAVAACFIGGASTTGGSGTVFGTIVGALIMGVLNNGMSILGISVDWQQAIKGIVLLFAVAFDIITKKRSNN